MPKQIFVNLPVKNLEASKAFFTKLGFTFNPRFTDDKAACLVISESIFSMLITEPFFKTFTDKNIADTSKVTEVIIALSASSKSEADAIFNRALDGGATEHRPAEDQGWMYGRSFKDLDGHVWEVFFIDEARMPPPPASETI